MDIQNNTCVLAIEHIIKYDIILLLKELCQEYSIFDVHMSCPKMKMLAFICCNLYSFSEFFHLAENFFGFSNTLSTAMKRNGQKATRKCGFFFPSFINSFSLQIWPIYLFFRSGEKWEK